MSRAGAPAPKTAAPASGDSRSTIMVKLVLLGDAGVGKSSVVLRFVQNDFQENKEPTIGAAFLTQKCRLEDKVIKFEIWDTAGQERFHSLAPMYYRNAQAAVVAYDITKGPSLDKAKSWVKELQRQANPNIVIALIGNKLDLVDPSSSSDDLSSADAASDAEAEAEPSEPDDATAVPAGTTAADGAKKAAPGGGKVKRQVDKAEAEAYAQEAGLLFFETSAKSGEGVVEVFTEIAKKIPIEHILSTSNNANRANRAGQQAAGSANAGANAQAGGGGRVRLGAGGAAGEGNKEGCAC